MPIEKLSQRLVSDYVPEGEVGTCCQAVDSIANANWGVRRRKWLRSMVWH